MDNSWEDIALSFSPSLSFFVISFLFFLLLIDATNTIIGPWIKLVDTEIQDAVADAQKNDELAQKVVRGLTDPSVSPSCWTIVLSAPDSSTHLLLYNGCLYIPDNLGLRRQIVSDHHDTLMAEHLGALAMSCSI